MVLQSTCQSVQYFSKTLNTTFTLIPLLVCNCCVKETRKGQYKCSPFSIYWYFVKTYISMDISEIALHKLWRVLKKRKKDLWENKWCQKYVLSVFTFIVLKKI